MFCCAFPIKLECPQCGWKIVWRQQSCIVLVPPPSVDECPRCGTETRLAVPGPLEALNPIHRFRAKYLQLRNVGRLLRHLLPFILHTD